MHPLTLAVMQCAPTWADVVAGVENHVDTVRIVGDLGARLAVFPELSLTGYDLASLASPGGASSWIEPGDARLDPLRAECAASGVTALVGAAVRDQGRRQITALRLTPDGEVVVHAKAHPHGAERALVEPGPPPEPFELDGWRVAVGVCADLAHPSHAAAAAARDADLYAVGAVYDAGDERRLDLHGGARAMDHRMVVAVANTVGPRPGAVSCGASAVWLPDGAVLARAGTDEELIVVTVDRDPGRSLRAADDVARGRVPAQRTP